MPIKYPNNKIPKENGKILVYIEWTTSDKKHIEVIRDFTRAFKFWSNYSACPIMRTNNKSKAYIKLFFKWEPKPFEKKVLAYAYWPWWWQYDWHMYVNDKYDRTSYELYKVIVHEMGHALNLLHSDNKNDVMYPTHIKWISVMIDKTTQKEVLATTSL